MKAIFFRLPAIACGVISLVALLSAIRKGGGRSEAVFYAFLPACFLFMGGVMMRMDKEISRLRRRVSRLEQAKPPEFTSTISHHPPAKEG